MSSIQLLDKTRKINKLLHNNNSQKVVFNDICKVLTEVMNSNVLVISKRKDPRKKWSRPHRSPSSADLRKCQRLCWFFIKWKTINDPFHKWKRQPFHFRIWVRYWRLLCDHRTNRYRRGKIRNIIYVPPEGKLFHWWYYFSRVWNNRCRTWNVKIRKRRSGTERRKKGIVDSAISTLSFTEHKAVLHILEELEGNEGVLVASKIADRFGITRSVVVNALRKLESAGVVETRSSGMKGTYIKVVNDFIFDEITKLD